MTAPRDLDLKSLRLLVSACDFRNIRLAAEHAHIEPSAVSKRIAHLEQTLGTRLLERGRRGVQPTPAGLALVEHARDMLFTVERIASDVASFQRGIKGRVRLVASPSAIAESLPDDVAAFMRDAANANIQVDIEERYSKDLVRVVADGGASLGVCWDSVDFRGLATRPYRRDELVLAVPAAHALARRASLRFEQTLDFDHVGMPPATAVTTMLQRAAARAGRPIGYRVIVSNFDAALRVVAAGLGISVIPRPIASRYVRERKIRAIRLDDAWAQRRFAVCCRDEATLPAPAARMLQFLAERAAGE